MTRVVILTPRSTAPVSRSIIDALKNRGVTVMKINPGRVSLEFSAEDFDAVRKYFTDGEPRGGIVRGIGTHKIKKIYHRLGVLRVFEECGTYLLNGRECLEIATNKALTTHLLMKSGIQTPRTITCEGFKKAIEAFRALGGDVVLKPLFGSKGVGIMRLSDEGYASNVFYNLDRLDEVFYLQEYREHGNEDMRVMVLGDQVLCGMKRVADESRKDSWKTNVFVGARGEGFNPSDEIKEISLKAARAVKADFAGVDLIETRDGGIQVIEVNAVPGFTELQKTTRIDIAQSLVDFFLDRIKR